MTIDNAWNDSPQGIKWPESVDMHEDLYWLANNVSEWPSASRRPSSCKRRWERADQGVSHIAKWHSNYWVNFQEWSYARQQLGLDQPTPTASKCLDNAWDVTPEEEKAWAEKQKKSNPKGEKYSAYFKDVRHIDTLDVYRVVSLFDCEKHGHPISHAAKKLLLSGSRTGGKDVESDVREAIDSLHRWLEMREEDARA